MVETGAAGRLNEREALLLLNLVPGIGSVMLTRLLQQCGGATQVLGASQTVLQAVEGIGPERAAAILGVATQEPVVRRELERAQAAGLQVVTVCEPGYPAWLRTIYDPPPVLYVKGAFGPADDHAVAIVGMRAASPYGVSTAAELAGHLAAQGWTVISGLARGIDEAAHRGALAARGRTLAVLGSGFGRMYPPEHAALAEEISRHGAVVSEFPLDAPPHREHFPRRNRIISGLSRGVVVVEAGERSGALITARLALEQGRDVFAVPGPVTSPRSRGTHQLLREGATVVESADDVLAVLGPQIAGRQAQPPRAVLAGGEGGEMEERVLQAVADTPAHVDEITVRAGLPIEAVLGVLMRLELQHVVQQLPGACYVRR